MVLSEFCIKVCKATKHYKLWKVLGFLFICFNFFIGYGLWKFCMLSHNFQISCQLCIKLFDRFILSYAYNFQQSFLFSGLCTYFIDYFVPKYRTSWVRWLALYFANANFHEQTQSFNFENNAFLHEIFIFAICTKIDDRLISNVVREYG